MDCCTGFMVAGAEVFVCTGAGVAGAAGTVAAGTVAGVGALFEVGLLLDVWGCWLTAGASLVFVFPLVMKYHRAAIPAIEPMRIAIMAFSDCVFHHHA